MAHVTVAGLAGFWQKLRRRKIVEWGIAYSAGTWVLLQALEYASSTFHWPQPIQQYATLTLLAGLPVVLVIAWYHGDRGEQHLQRNEVALIALLVTTGAVLVWRYEPVLEPKVQESATGESAPSDTLAGLRATPTGQRPVVAILPFESAGETADDLTFADGLQSEILGELSRNHGFDVVAAASMERFRDTTVSATDAGRAVGATYVLHGSLEQVGERMRIRARLVDVRTSAEAWAEAFDREFTAARLFTIRGEIVLAVANALTAGLTDVEPNSASAASTQNLDAWALEKTARALLEKRTTQSIIEAENLFRQVIAMDPGYARAYSGLADAVWLKADYAGLPLQPAVAEAERLLNQALRLDPDLAEALATRAKLAQERFDFASAEETYQRVFDLNPSYARAYHWYAQLMYQQGRQIEAVHALQRAVNLDPMSLSLRMNMGLGLTRIDDPTDALAWMEKAREIDPGNPAWLFGRAVAFFIAGRHDEALHAQLELLGLQGESAVSMAEVAQSHLELGDLDGARAWLARAMEEDRDVARGASVASLLALYAGELDEALDHARRALALHPYDSLAFMVHDAVLLDRADPPAVISAVQTSFPELSGPGAIQVRVGNLLAATDLALAFQLRGEAARSEELLDAASAFLEVARRNGASEHLVSEARVAAIRGDTESALKSLEELIAKGWRGPSWQYFRDHDPALDRLRTQNRFRAAFDVVEQDVRSQRERSERSGDLRRPPPRTASD